MNKITRREFLRLSSLGIGSAVAINALAGCASFSSERRFETRARFTHGVASGDPLSNKVILWTRAVPGTEVDIQANTHDIATVSVQLALDEDFNQIVVEQGLLSTTADKDFTIKVDVTGLEPDSAYFYRFLSRDNISVTGKTRTLPVAKVEEVKLLVLSCSYYSAGYFHVYKEAAKVQGVNAVIHLGDYIYEYGPGVYADEEATAMNRVMQPNHEIISLDDYRQRYAQTRSDNACQTLHANHPMIAVWDDHEVTNDTWSAGAENHSVEEGIFSQRRLSALQAYAEWMPIRPDVHSDINSIQRDFQFGDLVNLSLIDTRLTKRDQQLSFTDFSSKVTGEFDGKGFFTALNNQERELIGKEQLEQIKTNFSIPAKWHVLGQQVLMGKMYLPAPIVTQQISNADYGKLVYKSKNASETLSQTELAILKAPSIPYNLDAWDGYPAERERVLQLAKDNNVNLVIVAGDTHNAWANDLFLDEEKIGVEFATSSVTSPGFEKYVGTTADDEQGTVAAISGLKYCNLVERGFMTVRFTQDAAEAEWTFVDTVKSRSYQVLNDRRYLLKVNH